MKKSFAGQIRGWKLMRSTRAMFVLAVSIGIFFSSNLLAQVAGTSTIQGTITDGSGAVVPGAKITATEIRTGRTASQTTSSSGRYVLSALPSGEYVIEVHSPNFRPLVQQHVVLDALTIRGLDLVLTTGAVSDTVTVTTLPPDLHTENGSLETTIPNTTYSALPIGMENGPKSAVGFLSLVPGVTTNGSIAAYNFNGGAGNTSALYLNGLPLQVPELQGDTRNLAATSTEIVDQFQVITGGVPSYYDGQGLTNLVLKAGTNEFHGDVYENVRNTVLDAAGQTPAGQPPIKTPVEHQNEFGVTVGGPVLRDRLFFFGNYDGYRLRSGTVPSFYTAPTLKERNGDFSELSTPIYDPASTTCTGGVCTRTAFSGNIIPPEMLSKISQSLQSYLPDPQNSDIANNFANQFVSGTNQNMYVGKVDATLTKDNHASFLFQYGTIGNVGLPGSGLPLPYAIGRYSTNRYYLGQVNDTHVITPHLVNIFGFELFQDPSVVSVPTIGGNYASTAGLTGLPDGVPQQAFPGVQFAGPNSPTAWATNSSGQAFSEVSQVELYQDNIQWIHGKHSTTFGGQLIYQQENIATSSAVNSFDFSSAETAGFTPSTDPHNPNSVLDMNTGNAYASFLLGAVHNASVQDNTPLAETGARYRNYAVYAQDDWKITPKLTLNIGLRYTIPRPYVESQNRVSWLNPDLPNAAVGGFHGALQFAGNGPDSCHCRTDVKTHFLTLGPRVGFAYAATDKTVIRSAFSIVHFNGGALGGAGLSFGVSTLGYTATPSSTSPDGFTPAFNWNNGFPAYQHPPFFDSTLNAGYTTTIPAGGAFGYDRPETAGRSPYAENWNLTIEQQLPASVVMSLTYTGSSSHFLAVNGGSGIYSNQIDPKYLQLGGLLAQPANATTIAQAQAILPGVQLPYPNFAGTIGQMVRPFPQYSGTGATFAGTDPWATFATASYNAFQATLSRRMTNGLYFLAAYTWSKTMDEAAGTVNFNFVGARSAYNLAQERSVSSGDIPHQLSLTYVYDLPFGRGHRFGQGALLNTIVGGWQLSGIQQYSSGTPIGTMNASCPNNLPLTNGCYADYAPAFSGNPRINGAFHGGRAGIDVHAFQNPAPYTFGTTPRTMAYSLRNPASLNENFALTKDFKVRERYTIRLRADAFNAFNRTRWGSISTDITSGSFGIPGSQVNTPRQMQFEAYIKF